MKMMLYPLLLIALLGNGCYSPADIVHDCESGAGQATLTVSGTAQIVTCAIK